MPVCGASDGVESEGDHNLHEGHHPWAGVCRGEGPGADSAGAGGGCVSGLKALHSPSDSTTQAVWAGGPISNKGGSAGQGHHHHPGQAEEPLLS